MTKHLVIVESPAKSKTIKKYLWPDFEVKASFGHVADLAKKNMGIDIDNNFLPTYEISPDKKKVIKELKTFAKWRKVWIATDEDREGEAIWRHVANALWLDIATTSRIVFHEITQEALQKAVKNPRTIDVDLVDAQQARRVLDRLVGFELSPVLWKKIKGWLSAGRVQSVAVRLLVDRERDIAAFAQKSYYKIVADCLADGKQFSAEVKKKIRDSKKAEQFLHDANGKDLTISSVETKPWTKKPSAPFTTSTLQQEASRKMGFSVAQTMRVAQKLYEAGLITYMRTDSINMAKSAVSAACTEIKRAYGQEFVFPRVYKWKNANAQEAHECIRPTDFSKHNAWWDDQQKRLYHLIWRRSIASQMADARVEKTKAIIDVPWAAYELIANGEMIAFEGFLSVYLEGKDDEDETTKDMLPPLREWQKINAKAINATEQRDRHAPRFTEASLVKELEKQWIWRPSTYAPTISTIQKRWYVELTSREWEQKDYIVMTLKNETVSTQTKTRAFGAEKKKLFPTDTGLIVTDFLLEHFPDIMEYAFTAQVENEFDHIASWNLVWTDMLEKFYRPFHKTVDEVTDGADRVSGERVLGKDPTTWKIVLVRLWRYGPLVQLGEQEDEEKQFSSIPSWMHMNDMTIEDALECFKLPRSLWEREEKDIRANIGRFGPYVQWWSTFASLKKTEEYPDDEPLTVSRDRAIELILAKRQKDLEKILREWEYKEKRLALEKWRRGPYIKYGRVNIKLPNDIKERALAKELSEQEIVALLEASGEVKEKKTTKKKAVKKKTVKKKVTKKKVVKKVVKKKTIE